MNRIVLMVLRNFWRAPHAYWKLCRHAKHPDRYPESERYAHIRYIMTRAVKSGNIKLDVFGRENIPEEDGFLIYANHQGLFDIVAMAAEMPRPWGAILKKELYKIPVLKQLVDSTKSFPMDRDDLKQSMVVIKNTTKEVIDGRNYLIFPEGTRSKAGNKMLEFHSGSFKCATKAKCVILPIAFRDSFKVLDQKGSKQVSVEMHILPQIPYEEYKEMNTVELAKYVHDKIAAVVEREEE